MFILQALLGSGLAQRGGRPMPNCLNYIILCFTGKRTTVEKRVRKQCNTAYCELPAHAETQSIWIQKHQIKLTVTWQVYRDRERHGEQLSLRHFKLKYADATQITNCVKVHWFELWNKTSSFVQFHFLPIVFKLQVMFCFWMNLCF